jgi:2-oxoglutarate dehydrogenase E1 component
MIDWGTSEALAFASLIDEGYHVRISGQDVERGTFSHRHAHVFHQDKDGYVIPINNASNDEGVRTFIATNSHLSEFAVLGYEYGYASANPNTLSIWEAQFGDFANGAQVIIDQFVSSGETKWNVKNGLVMLLPHGYDGNGPEHSSSRIERYLQLVDDDDNMPDPKVTSNEINRSVNMHVCNPSTGANFFHLLRKQMRRTYRKPLIISSPKKLLKYAGACSTIEEFDENHSFQKVIPDQNASLVANDKVKQVILCTGQVFFDLEATRKNAKRDDVAIVRCEQLAPFPKREVQDILKQYKNASVTWAQEEHKNSGVWTYAEPRLRNIMQHMGRKDQPRYVGRPISASTATGYGKQHKKELSDFLEDAMSQ